MDLIDRISDRSARKYYTWNHLEKTNRSDIVYELLVLIIPKVLRDACN